MNYWPLVMLIWVVFLSVYVNNYYLGKDAFFYAKLGESLWTGMGITVWEGAYVVLPPGYPILIGAIDRVIDDLAWSGKTVGMATYFASLFVFREIAKCLLKEPKWVNVSVLLFSLNSGIVLNAISGYSESFFILVFLAIVWVYLESLTFDWIQLSVTSVLWGLLYYIKPEGLIIGGVVFILLVTKYKREVFVYFVPVLTVILIFPYFFFLRSYTGRWQPSGKTYINLVFGELDGPHQKPVFGEYPDRYLVSDFVSSDPTLAKSVSDYWQDSHNDFPQRIFVNAHKLINQWSEAFSWAGIALGCLGVYFSKTKYWWILILPILGYLFFFILQRSLTVYYWIWIVLMAIGLKELLFRLNVRWPDFRYGKFGIAVLIVYMFAFNMRSLVKVTLGFLL